MKRTRPGPFFYFQETAIFSSQARFLRYSSEHLSGSRAQNSKDGAQIWNL
jgi:hypothetical protein